MNAHIQVEALKQDITALLLEYPELEGDEILRADVLEGETNIETVIGNLVNATRDAETMAEAISLRAKEISERKGRFERRAEAARRMILSIMDRAHLPKLQLTEATLSTRFIAPSPIVTDPSLLPDDCVRIERKPSMTAIKAAVEAKRDIPGIAMSNGKLSLTIRTK